MCKACRAAYYQANRERMDANSARWRKENPERAKELAAESQKRLLERDPDYFRRWASANREAINANARARYDPEREAERRADYKERNPYWWRDFYAANRDSERERWQKRYRENAEAERARKKVYRDANPAIGRASSQRRRARNRLVLVEDVDEQLLAFQQEGRCGICSTDLYEPIELDHIVPICREGNHTQSNCQLAHRSCNRQKHDKLPEECGRILPIAS